MADEDGAIEGLATVTIQRTHIGRGIIDLTVAFKLQEVEVDNATNREWVLSAVIDEDGNPTSLSKTERELAYCLVRNGVDETGR